MQYRSRAPTSQPAEKKPLQQGDKDGHAMWCVVVFRFASHILHRKLQKFASSLQNCFVQVGGACHHDINRTCDLPDIPEKGGS